MEHSMAARFSKSPRTRGDRRGRSRSRRAAIGSAAAALALGVFLARLGSIRADEPELAPIRVGIIGADTSHAVAFTKLFHEPGGDADLARVRVVAVYPPGSRDIPSSVERVPAYVRDLADLGVESVPTIEALIARVDAVLLETNDGRPHLEQALPVLRARKPLFIDKPFAASLADALAIAELSALYGTPIFSSSALRYSDNLRTIAGGRVGEILGVDFHGPASLEPTHPDLSWYGIHCVETLYTLLGRGCETLTRTKTPGADAVVGTWSRGRLGIYRGIREGRAGFGGTVYGSGSIADIGEFSGYRGLVVEIARFFATGKPPIAIDETLEIYAFIEAADVSLRGGGVPVTLEVVRSTAKSRYLVGPGFVVDTAFPGGNGALESVNETTIRFRPDRRDHQGPSSWWALRVRGSEGRTLRFELGGSYPTGRADPTAPRAPFGPLGPAVSTDHGTTWKQLGAESVRGGGFALDLGDADRSVLVACAVPYVRADLGRFLSERVKSPWLEVGTLTRSREGRDVEIIRAGRRDDAALRVAVTARHHAGEASANFVLEGLIDAALADDEMGRWFQTNAVVEAVPFVDKDGVENGDPGRLGVPLGHWLDYGESSIHPEAGTIRARFRPALGAVAPPTDATADPAPVPALALAIDIHSSESRGAEEPGNSNRILIVAAPSSEPSSELSRFTRILERVAEGPLPYSQADGLSSESDSHHTAEALEKCAASWFAKEAGARCAMTIVVPQASARGVEVSPDSARAFGRDVARAIAEYLRTLPASGAR
jgi:hypothetical protein